MLMKYPNVYADTSMVYMDSPKNWYAHLFSVNMNLNWLQNCFQDKVMFGSNNPAGQESSVKHSRVIRRTGRMQVLPVRRISFCLVSRPEDGTPRRTSRLCRKTERKNWKPARCAGSGLCRSMNRPAEQNETRYGVGLNRRHVALLFGCNRRNH